MNGFMFYRAGANGHFSCFTDRRAAGCLFNRSLLTSLCVDALGELDKLAGTFLGTRKAFDQIADALPSPWLLVPPLSATIVVLS